MKKIILAALILEIIFLPLIVAWAKQRSEEKQAPSISRDFYKVNCKVLYERLPDEKGIVIHDKQLQTWFLKNYPLYGVK